MADPRQHATNAAQQVAALAWAGRQAEAVAAADAALADSGLAAAQRFELLELRAESHAALGELTRAAADVAAMTELARAGRSASFATRALQSEALILMRGGDALAALNAARQALAAAHRSDDPRLEAQALIRLAEAQFRQGTLASSRQAAATAGRAVALADSLGDNVLCGRALWCVQAACNDLGRAAEARRASRQSLALARETGDLFGQAAALNSLVFNESDVAACLRLLKQALALFRAAGWVEREAMVTDNLASQYAGIGLYRQARRLHAAAIALGRRTGARHGLTDSLWRLAHLEATLGHADAARRLAAEAAERAKALGGTQYGVWPHWIAGHLAMDEDRPAEAARHFERAAREAGNAIEALAMNCRSRAAQAHVAAGVAARALKLSAQVTQWHQSKNLASLASIDRHTLWWHHSLALRANGLVDAAHEVLERAYGFLCAHVAGLGDEGLRRNSLNKPSEARGLVLDWIAAARASGLPRALRSTPRR